MNKKSFIGVALLVLFCMSPLMIPTSADTEIRTAFSINLLSPNTSPARNQWSMLMEQTLPKIGIGVSFHESTGWGNIAPRTWDYPLIDFDYVPTYAEGGYDILFVGWSWDLDLNLQSLYESTAITPYGDNHYQYSNPAYDSLLEEFMVEVEPTARAELGYQLQNIIYEDVPGIAIVYPRSLFGFKEGLAGIDDLLIASSNQRVENWDDPEDHIIKYAVPADLKEPNYYVLSSYYDLQWMQGVYGSPAKRAPGTHGWETEIASSWTVSEIINDKINISLTLDPDAKFSNGDSVLPSDVEYSYELHMTPAVGSGSYGTYTYWFDSNDSISVVGPDVAGGELLFELTGVFNLAESLLYNPLIQKTTVETAISAHGYDIFNEVPLDPGANVGDALVMSCGPMMLADYDPVQSVAHCVPNPYWHGTPMVLEHFYLTFISGKDSAVASLMAGEIDIMDAQYFPDISDFEGVTGIEGILVKDPSHQEMSINMKHPVMGTGELTPVGTAEAAKFVRKAISHATPRDIIVDEILNGLGAPATTAVPDSVVGYDDTLEPYTYDLDVARSYIEDAGFIIEFEIPTQTGITSLVFLSFLGLAAMIAFKKYMN
ncbi:MAG: ABC transporter substrate-binding protein [Candidatus Heimdallarchaeaceae archaeon]